jgi:hypothetical protein
MILRPIRLYDFRLVFVSANAHTRTIAQPSTIFSASIAVGTPGDSLTSHWSQTQSLQLMGASAGASHRSAVRNREEPSPKLPSI